MGSGQGKRHFAGASGAGDLQCCMRALLSGGVVTDCSFIIPNTEGTSYKRKMKACLKM